jgi:hypothetical protein
MTKLSLELDQLNVETFETDARVAATRVEARGNVYTYTCGNIPDRPGEMDLITRSACCV